MKILIELPTWLGDTVMTTPVIEFIYRNYKDIHIELIGSKTAIEIYKNHPNISSLIEIKKDFFSLIKISRNYQNIDKFISFRTSFRSKLIGFFISSKSTYFFDHKKYQGMHQVEKYSRFISDIFNISFNPSKLKIYLGSKVQTKNNIIGINPGAAYGSAKRWPPEYYSELIEKFSDSYFFVILGSESDISSSEKIEASLKKAGLNNFHNLCGKSSIDELVNIISGLDLFITGDTGPMHIAAAFQVKTIALFGPTDYSETRQWKNVNEFVLKKEMVCQPCKKRECPLGHHACMRDILPNDVYNTSLKLLARK